MKKNVYILISIVFLIVFIFSSIKIISYYKDNIIAKKIYDEIKVQNNIDENNINTTITPFPTITQKDIIQTTIIPTPIPTKEIEYVEKVSLGVDWEDYLDYNEMVGWIQIENNEYVNFPIMQHDDNSYYLSHLYDGQENKLGSIFMDRRNSWDDKHIVIYGHNFRNTNMFSTLTNYQEESYANEHRYIYIETLDGKTHIFYVFSCYITQSMGENDGFITYNFDTDNEYYQYWLDSIEEKSIISSKFLPTLDDKILTLSTCAGNGDKMARCIIHGFEIENKTIKQD